MMDRTDKAGRETGADPNLDLSDNSPKGLFERFKHILTDPKDFFERMPLEGGIKDPIIFVAAIALLVGLGEFIATFKPMMGVQSIIFRVLLSFISAGFLMVLSRGLGGTTGNYESTYRAFAYASAPLVVSWIPFINVIAGLYSIYLLRLAIQRVWDLTPQRAWMVLGIYIVAMVGVVMVLFFFSFSAMLGAKSAADAITGVK